MNGPEVFLSVAADVERELRFHRPSEVATIPTTVSANVATALLQKSVRRGRVDLALSAAGILMRTSPDRLWRRLAIIAFEDVGLGDLATVYSTIVAVSHRKRLSRNYGPWTLASFVVAGLTTAPKCRATDDLYEVTDEHPAWVIGRHEQSNASLDDMLVLIAGGETVEARAIGIKAALQSEGGQPARGRARIVFDLLCEIGLPHTLVEICREGYRLTGEVICGFLPLLFHAFEGAESAVRSDELPAETMIRGVPGWALDKFSPEGRRALSVFIGRSCPTSNWLRAHVPHEIRMSILGHALFHVESGLVADRLIWPTGEQLRWKAEFECWPFPRTDAANLLSLMREDIAELNRVREATYGA